jgi:hypothetical protein
LADIQPLLSKFQFLERLTISGVAIDADDISEEEFRDDYDFVQAAGKHCLRLRLCCTPREDTCILHPHLLIPMFSS